MRAIAAFLISMALAATLAGCQNKTAASGAGQGDMDLGNAKAKVTVYEYASVACPICAKWNNEMFQPFKAKYIDTGKVHYVAREMLTHDPAAAAAGFLLARCAGKDKYFSITDAIYHQQDDMFAPGSSPRAVLLRIAQSAGFTEQQFDACVGNDENLKALNDRVDSEAKQYNINSTPSFVINGKLLEGYQDMATLDKAIADATAAAK
jgi:protein-disulfide isomerase